MRDCGKLLVPSLHSQRSKLRRVKGWFARSALRADSSVPDLGQRSDPIAQTFVDLLLSDEQPYPTSRLVEYLYAPQPRMLVALRFFSESTHPQAVHLMRVWIDLEFGQCDAEVITFSGRAGKHLTYLGMGHEAGSLDQVSVADLAHLGRLIFSTRWTAPTNPSW